MILFEASYNKTAVWIMCFWLQITIYIWIWVQLGALIKAWLYIRGTKKNEKQLNLMRASMTDKHND
jgi:hypothetical protein